MQKISSFHQFILEQILKFHDLKGCAHLDHNHRKASNSEHDWTP